MNTTLQIPAGDQRADMCQKAVEQEWCYVLSTPHTNLLVQPFHLPPPYMIHVSSRCAKPREGENLVQAGGSLSTDHHN